MQFLLTVEKGEDGIEIDLALVEDMSCPEISDTYVNIKSHNLIRKEITDGTPEDQERALLDELADNVSEAIFENVVHEGDERVRLN